MVGRLLSVKAAAAVLAALLLVGGVAAAATGRLPGQAQPAAEQAPATTGHAVGPAARVELGVAVKQGLCQAWRAGQGAEGGRRADLPALGR
jgi:hypothetical protein